MVNSGGDGGDDLHNAPGVEDKRRRLVVVVVDSKSVEGRFVEHRLVERIL